MQVKVHSSFHRNEPPTINKVLAKENTDPDLPDFKRRTVYNIMKERGFEYMR